MLPDRVSNPGPLAYESGALPIALRGPATGFVYVRVGPHYNFVQAVWILRKIEKQSNKS